MAVNRTGPRIFSTTAFRLTAVSVGVFLIAAALLSWLIFWQVNRVLIDQVKGILAAEITALEQLAANGGVDALSAAIKLKSRSGVGLYFLVDRSGARLAGNLSRIPPEVVGRQGGAVFDYQSEPGGTRRLAVARVLNFEFGRLVVARDVEEYRRLVANVRSYTLWGFGFLGLFALGAGLFVSWLVLQRIEAMTDTSRAIMAGDMSQRLPMTGQGDELDRLAASLNDMLARIEQLLAGMREISDNIAHDLKTPVNRLRVRAEAALRDASGTEGYRAGLEQVIETADDIIKTFNALLLIARLEAGALEESNEEFELSAIVRDVAELYDPVAEEAGLTLDVNVPDAVMVRGNRHLIGQAVANLIDNAIKYSAPARVVGFEASTDTMVSTCEPAGSVAVSIEPTATAVDISVSDQGPGIEAEDRDKVLNRFVRLEKSRTKPGTGLGLSLVQAVARMHAGDVILGDNHPGLIVTLRLPLASGPLT